MSPRTEPSDGLRTRGRRVRWLLPAALLALMPKCVLCLLAYAGAALGVGGAEWCGVPGNGSTFSCATALAWIGAAGVVSALGVFAKCRQRRGDA